MPKESRNIRGQNGVLSPLSTGRLVVASVGAGWILLEDSYPNGAMYPGDGADDIGHRCTEMYRGAR